jgi:hypothetical protein
MTKYFQNFDLVFAAFKDILEVRQDLKIIRHNIEHTLTVLYSPKYKDTHIKTSFGTSAGTVWYTYTFKHIDYACDIHGVYFPKYNSEEIYRFQIDTEDPEMSQVYAVCYYVSINLRTGEFTLDNGQVPLSEYKFGSM